MDATVRIATHDPFAPFEALAPLLATVALVRLCLPAPPRTS
jgi:hypothetical protein